MNENEMLDELENLRIDLSIIRRQWENETERRLDDVEKLELRISGLRDKIEADIGKMLDEKYEESKRFGAA